MKLPFRCVPYARHWWRMHSLQGAAAIVVTCAIKAASLVVLFPFLPWPWVAVIVVVAAVLLAIGALRAQDFTRKPPSNAAGH